MSGAGRLVARTGRWVRRRLLNPTYPLTAVEVRSSTVGAVRLVRSGGGVALGGAACLGLPEGTLRVSMIEPNVVEADAFRRTLSGVLARAGAQRSARVALVLPDPVARVAILPAAEVRAARRAETEEILRFRLRKVVPFDIRDARLSWVTVGEGAAASLLVSAVARPVLESYEAACRALGLHPGLIELAGLSLLETLGGTPGDRLLVNWDDGYVSLVLVRAGVPVLMRSLTGSAASPEQVVREVSATVLYYSERLKGPGLAAAALRCTVLDPEAAAELLREPMGGLTPAVLDPLAALGSGRIEGSSALAGAAACVLGRAA